MPLLGRIGVWIFWLAECAKNCWRGRKIILTFFILKSPLFGILIVVFSLSLSLLTAEALLYGTWNLRSKIQFELNIAMFQVNLCFRSCSFLTFVYCSSSVDVYNSLLSLFLLFFFLYFFGLFFCVPGWHLGAFATDTCLCCWGGGSIFRWLYFLNETVITLIGSFAK